MQESSLYSRQVLGEFRESPGKWAQSRSPDRQFTFGQVRFDRTGELWHDGNARAGTPRAAAVRAAERAPQLVTKQELFDRVGWLRGQRRRVDLPYPGGAAALKDDARRPRYIETHHRRGYRLLARPTRPRFKAAPGLAD